MKKILFLGGLLFLLGCKERVSESNDYLYKQEIARLNKKIDSLILLVKEYEEEVEGMQDEIQFREGEISYWGRKYDSIKQLRTKK
jgi:hypothetical protein